MVTVAVARPTFFVRADAKKKNVPKRPKLRPIDVQREIQHAQLLCYNFEDTAACKVAWDRVEELSTALARQCERELHEAEDPISFREYDV